MRFRHSLNPSFRTFCLGVTGLIYLLSCSPQEDTLPNKWVEITKNDLLAAHQMMLESHPGPVDVEMPDFLEKADISFKDALMIADQAKNIGGYSAALLAYTAGFRDGHFVVFPKENDELNNLYEWPGMIPAWRADKVTIVHTEPEESDLLGAELISCDGRSPDDLILEHVFGFDPAKPDQIAYWARQAPGLFLYSNNPAIEKIKTCEFRSSDDQVFNYDLNWRPKTDDYWKHRRKARFGKTPDISFREIKPSVYWINMPDFSPDEDDVKSIRAVFDQMAARRDELLNAKAIVIDVRGNEGGSSAWGQEFIKTLWGENYQASRERYSPTYAEWRLSQDNVDHLDWIVKYVKENGHDEIAASFDKTRIGARAAFEKGEDLYREPDDDESQSAPQSADIPNPVKAWVYFLTHGECASSCLDFADALFELEGITHIGYPTSSDTNYLEIRMQDLPSDLGMMAIPTKVWRGRLRKSGEYYQPVHQYDSTDWSDAAMEAWVDSLIQAEAD